MPPQRHLAFGPVPSRRLGHSLGINNIPPKECSYSCVYCQVGPTLHPSIVRRSFFSPRQIAEEVSAHVDAVRARGELIDYLTFVPDGEPTLDSGLGAEIELLRPLGKPIAVITNASLLWLPEVREDLAKADWVSLKIDTVYEHVWRALNRPAPELRLLAVLGGVRAFAASFPGELVTETMLVDGLNDGEEDLAATARFIAELDPARAFIATPVRPPASPDCRPATAAAVGKAYEIWSSNLESVGLLGTPQDSDFGATGDLAADLVSIASVHPMREDEVRALARKDGAAWADVERLVREARIHIVEYQGTRYFVATPEA